MLGKKKNGGRHGIEAVGDDSERDVVYTIEDVVKFGGQGLNVFGVERRDEGGPQTAENIVNNMIAFVFETGHFLLYPADAVVTAFQAGNEEVRSTAQDIGVELEKFEKFLVFR